MCGRESVDLRSRGGRLLVFVGSLRQVKTANAISTCIRLDQHLSVCQVLVLVDVIEGSMQRVLLCLDPSDADQENCPGMETDAAPIAGTKLLHVIGHKRPILFMDTVEEVPVSL